jgi:hypothetical protein
MIVLLSTGSSSPTCSTATSAAAALPLLALAEAVWHHSSSPAR